MTRNNLAKIGSICSEFTTEIAYDTVDKKNGMKETEDSECSRRIGIKTIKEPSCTGIIFSFIYL